MSTKASAALGIVAVVLALIILTIYLVNLAGRECKSNKDCTSAAYCGSDFACHAYPKEIVTTKDNYVPAALIVGISLMVAAWINRKKK